MNRIKRKAIFVPRFVRKRETWCCIPGRGETKLMFTPKIAITQSFVVSFFAVVVTLPGIAQAQNVSEPPLSAPRRITRQVARGVELVQEITPNGANGPLVVTILRVNLKTSGTRVEAALGQDRVWGMDATMGREIVSTLATRRKAVAGINAGFFPFAGNPLGLHMENGQIITEPRNRRTVLLLDKKGAAHLARFGFAGTVRGRDKTEIALSGLNRRPETGDSLLLYTPAFFPRTLRAAGRVEVVLATDEPIVPNRDITGRVVQIVEGGNAPLAPNTVVISGADASAEWLRRTAPVGATLRFRLNVNTLSGGPVDFANVRYSVAGGPRLLTNGQVTITLADEGIGQNFSTTRHPRTAIGVTREGVLLLVTVDGRQKTLSRGASLPELAVLMQRYGAVDALNLDGGGSSACVVRGLIVNSPSDGRERPVADALLVFGEPLKTPKPAVSLVQPGSLSLGSVQRFGNAPTGSDLIWGVTGGMGFVSQDGEFRALRPGQGTVALAGNGGLAGSVPVIVGAVPVSVPTGEFAATVEGSNDPAQPTKTVLTVRVANPDGDPLSGTPVVVTVTGGRVSPAQTPTDTRGQARFQIMWDASSRPQTVTITSPANRFAPIHTTRGAFSAIPPPQH